MADIIIPKRQNFPGAAMGIKDMRELHDYNRLLWSYKGFTNATVVGANPAFQMQLPGTARKLLGICVADDSLDITNLFTFEVNNEKVIDSVSFGYFSRQFDVSFMGREFIPIERMLSGNDAIRVLYQATTAGNLLTTLIYI